MELLSGFLFLLVYYQFGLSLISVCYIIPVSCLIAATFIDLEHGIIPDGIVVFCLAVGFFFNIFIIDRPFIDGILGMVVGGGTLLAIAALSLLVIHKEGMGGGDIKLMAAVGLFLGWRLTILALLLSFYLGGIIGLILVITKRGKPGDSIPFGPFIAAASVITILYGTGIIDWYVERFW